MHPLHYSLAKSASSAWAPLQVSWPTITGFDLSMHNTLIVASVLCARFIHTYLFGPLRVSELSRLTNQLTYTVCELLIAVILAREDVTLRITMVCLLFLILKWFHMVLQDRMTRLDWKEWKDPRDGRDRSRSQPSSLGFVNTNLRTFLALVLLNICDLFCLLLYVRRLSQRTIVSTIVAVELCVQYTNIWYLSGHFVVTALDQKPRKTSTLRDQWVARRKLVLHTLTTCSDVAKLWLYMGLSMYMVGKYCVPVHLFREAYLTLRIAIQKVRALIWLRRVSGQYDRSQFEQPKPEALAQNDHLCLVCRDCIKSTQVNSCVQLECCHIFHYDCLLDWLACNSWCPLCRQPVSPSKAI